MTRKSVFFEIVVVGAFLAVLGVHYAAFPDRMYSAGFDGLIFSAIIEGSEPDWKKSLLHAHHFLFSPVGIGFHRAFSVVGFSLDGGRAVEAMNAVLGCAALGVLYLGLRRAGTAQAGALSATFCMAVSYAFWRRASESQVYMLSLFTVTLCLVVILEHLSRPRTASYWALMATWILSVLCHQTNVLLAPAICATILLASDPQKRIRSLLGLAVMFGVFVVIPYLLAAYFEDGASDVRSMITWAFGELGRSFRTETGRSPYLVVSSRNILVDLVMIRQLITTAKFPWAALAYAGAGTALVGIGISFMRLYREGADQVFRRLALVSAVVMGTYAVFFSVVVVGALHFWSIQVIPLFLVGGYALGKLSGKTERVTTSLIFLGGLLLYVGNLMGAIYPAALEENNPSIASARFIRDHTKKGSTVVISGVGWGDGKVYIPAFGGRARTAFDLEFLKGPKDQAFENLHKNIEWGLNREVPVYVLSEMFDDVQVRDRLKTLWGIQPEELDVFFTRYRRMRVAAYSKEFVLYELGLKGPTARHYARMADKAINRKEWMSAIRYLEEANRREPTAGQYQNLGNCWYLLDKLTNAVVAWHRSLELDPRNENLRRLIEQAEDRLGRGRGLGT